jgi:hypothetical protein
VTRPGPRVVPVGAKRARYHAMCLLSGTIGATVLYPWAVLADPTGATGESLTQISEGRASIAIEWRGPTADIGQAGLLEWIERSAAIVRGYYGEFPVSAVRIRVSVVDNDRMGSGRTFGEPQPFIEVSVGRHITARALTDDWVLVHEMIHLALPEVAEEHSWLSEGIATYVEGIARTQAGNMTEVDLWKEYVGSMPRGLPQANDHGLDQTHTHARTYWGGALYCLMADVQIREKTHSRYGLQDALRAIRRAGGGLSTSWPIERILTTGDAATGTTVLRDLYLGMRDKPVSPDLNLIWAELGIRQRDGIVEFDDSARLAGVRRAITRSPPGYGS